jgi:hypothetical protein
MERADLELKLSTKESRRRKFLDEMNLVARQAALVALVGCARS